MYYHVSKVQNLKVIEPRVGTHGKSWVYAAKNPSIGLIFGSQMSDFDFITQSNRDGLVKIYECYPNAFNEIYSNRTCSIYELEDSGFKGGQTSWSVEFVSENPTKVLKETKVENLKEKLEEEIKLGNLGFQKFEDNKDYIEIIDKYIKERLIIYKILENGKIPDYILKHHSKVIEELKLEKENKKE